MKALALTFAAILAAASITACDRTSPEPATSVGGAPPAAGATTPPPTAGATDPSLPPAGPAVANQPGTAQRGTDSKANSPNSDLTKQEESTAMPKANQANNHSSPTVGTSPTKP